MEDFLSFVESCPTPYHFVAYARRLLSDHGFVELPEKDIFPDPLPSKSFVVRDERSIVAFTIGGGESVIGVCCHSDSPCFKLKPNYMETDGVNNLVHLAMYGKALWHTFIDRDLKVAGIVLVRNEDGTVQTRLVDSQRPIAIIPNLAIHHDYKISLTPTLDAEKHFTALIGGTNLKTYVASLLGINEEQILDWDLRFVPSQKSSVMNDLVFGKGLNNLANCYAGLMGLIDNREGSASTQIFAVFDNQEVGNCCRYGAKSDFLNVVLDAIFKDKKKYLSIKNRSLMISLENKHGEHPVYGSASDTLNPCKFGKGPVVVSTTRSSYASEMNGISIIKLAASSCDVPLQEQIAPNNQSVGPTMGPSIAFKTGIRTVDVGCGMLSMHSIRETVNWTDIESTIKLLKDLYMNYNNYRI